MVKEKARNLPLAALNEGRPKLLGKGFPLLWFAIAAFILFGRSITFNYTYLDDQTLILNNLDKLRSASYFFKAFNEGVFHDPSGIGFYYRPVLTLTFMADAMIGKGIFSIFHFSNIVYHILATFLLFLFFIETGYDRKRSFLFGLLFLVHPLVVQAVAWVPGRNDPLLAIFILASFLFWLKYQKSGSKVFVFFHLLFYCIALFTKENAVVLPVLIIFSGIFIMHTPWKRYAIPALGWVVLTVGWAVIRHHVLGSANEVGLSTQFSSMFRNMPALVPFIGKVLFPFSLSVFPILADMKVPSILGIMAIAGLAGLIGTTRPKQWAYYFFGLLWFLAFLVPSFISFNNQIRDFSEHRSYLSLAGILLVIMECNPVKKTDFSRFIPVAAIAGVLVLFSVLTFLHLRNFRDQFAFWQNAVDTSPSHAFNYNNLGAMYYLNGDLEKAEQLYREALRINPNETMVNGNIGLVCMNTNRPAEAEKYYLEEIRINPHYDNVYYNFGLLYYNHSKYEEAIRLWEKTLTVNPGYTDAYRALLFTYEKLGKREDYERIAAKSRENGVFPQK